MPRFLYVLAVFLFTGCVASGTAIQPTPETIKNYETGQTYEANTGSAVVEGGRVNTVPAFRPVESVRPPTPGLLGDELPELNSGQVWVALADREDGGFFLDPPESYPDRDHMLAINSDGSVVDGGWFADAGGDVTDKGEWPEGQLFERAEAVPQEGSFEFEILYSGKSEETVNMTYREYVDGMQRADYSQDLSYNIAEQDTISFRSIKMHVKEATSSSIRYEVIEDAGLPWLPQ